MRIYIAGPISGTTDWKERFREAEFAVVRAGHSPLNPADNWPDACTPPHPEGCEYCPPNSVAMRTAVHQLLDADAILLLSGWSDSKGASLEEQIARALELPRYWIVDGKIGLLGTAAGPVRAKK